MTRAAPHNRVAIRIADISTRTAARAIAAVLVAFGPPLAGTAHAEPQTSFTSATRFDALGRVTGTISPRPDGPGGTRQFLAVRNTYDAAGRLVKVENGSLSVWHGETVAPAAWTGFTILQTTDSLYDVMNRKVRDTVTMGGAVQSLTQFSYDERGRLLCTAVRMNRAAFQAAPDSACSLTPGPEGNDGPDRITHNVYDRAGQLLRVQRAYQTSLQQDEVIYEYSLNGQVTGVIDANGSRALMTYDGHDRQRRWIFPHRDTRAPNGTPDSTDGDYEQYEYDPNGNRTSLRKRDGKVIHYQYDNLNRLTVKTVPQSASGAAGYSVHYDYDLRNLQRYARFGSASGPGVTNEYDALGRLSSSASNMDGVSRPVLHRYDAAGRRDRMTDFDGFAIDYEYDQLGNLVALRENATVLLASFNYDGFGRRTAIAYNGASTSYGYEPTYHRASITHDLAGLTADQTLTYTFNAAGQVVGRTSANDAYRSTTAYAVDRSYLANGLNQYVQAGPANFTYDLNGNLISDGSTSFVYDAENRLVSASGAKSATLSYDPLGRMWQIVGPLRTSRFTYDGDAIIGEWGGGVLRRRYFHATNNGTGAPLFWYDWLWNLNRQPVFTDRLGSTIVHASDTGEPWGINGYDSWGIPNAHYGRFGYTGQVWVPELGIWLYRARFYSPTLGRFMQTDPIGYEDQINLYAYVGNDPINATDPTGERTVCSGKVCTTTIESTPPERTSPRTAATNAARVGTFNVRDTRATSAIDQATREMASMRHRNSSREAIYRMDQSQRNGITVVVSTNITQRSGRHQATTAPGAGRGADAILHFEPRASGVGTSGQEGNTGVPGHADWTVPADRGIPNMHVFNGEASAIEIIDGTIGITPLNFELEEPRRTEYRDRMNEFQGHARGPRE